MTEVSQKKWYIIQVYSGYELRVEKYLHDYIERYNMEEYFGDILIPTEQVIENIAGKKKKTDRKFFPGYVFIQMYMNKDTWHFVKNVPNVMRFIGGSPENPAPLSIKEAEDIINYLAEVQDKPRPKIMFQTGELVRVIDGPFKEFNGTVEEADYEKNKIRVSVSIFGRSTPVELLFNQVEKTS